MNTPRQGAQFRTTKAHPLVAPTATLPPRSTIKYDGQQRVIAVDNGPDNRSPNVPVHVFTVVECTQKARVGNKLKVTDRMFGRWEP